MIKSISLLELNKNIQETINNGFAESVWVVAEISEIKVNRNGHCYLEFIEKDALNDSIIAKTRATIWAFTFRMLKPYFENASGHELTIGLKVLVSANVEFHELYGLSLNITDIDPNYTLGDLALKKAETIKTLEDDGIIDMNKDLPFPIVPQKIAIISSETAAGYQDFINQLNNNSEEYKYYTKLFPSIMQGMQAEESIIKSLENIYNYENFFDIVVIIRGGGSQSDLQCFNSYQVATNVAQFPLPVITGIGHDKDETVVDIVSYKKLKTPTAAAEYIIEKTSTYEEKLLFIEDIIKNYSSDIVRNEKARFISYSQLVVPTAKIILEKNNNKIARYKDQCINNVRILLTNKHSSLNQIAKNSDNKTNKILHKSLKKLNKIEYNISFKSSLLLQKNKLIVDQLKNRAELSNPENILKRGYSITYVNGERLNAIKKITKNDVIITKLSSGFIRSTVNEKMINHKIKTKD
ncbi:MAG: exodeoxyribonuclease VII large subunit [Bacteroidales bacterium]|nr:exodeoxyribonuclease VII large subunit [Bacteroidales bacterium]